MGNQVTTGFSDAGVVDVGAVELPELVDYRWREMIRQQCFCLGQFLQFKKTHNRRQFWLSRICFCQ